MFEDSSSIDKPFASSSGRVEFIIFEETLLTLDTYTRVVLDSIQEVVGQQRAELETLRKAYPGWEYIWFTQAEWTMGTEGRLAWIEDLFPRFLYGSFLALLLSALEPLLVNIVLIFVDFAQIKDQLRKGGVIERVLKMLKERGVQIRIPSAIWDSLMALRRARNEFVHFAPMLLVARSGSRGYSPRKIASRSNL